MPDENSNDIIAPRRKSGMLMRSFLSKINSDSRFTKSAAQDKSSTKNVEDASTSKGSSFLPKKKRNSFSQKGSSFKAKQSLSRLIEKQDWVGIRSLFQPQEKDDGVKEDKDSHFARLKDFIDACIDYTGENALHSLCRFRPPLDVVKLVVEIDPNLVEERDCLERTPAHIAAGWGASSGVIEYVLKLYPTAAFSRDVQGKFPLHAACELFELVLRKKLLQEKPKPLKMSSFRQNSIKSKNGINEGRDKVDNEITNGPDVGVFQQLLRFAPNVVNMPDDFGYTPLQYAEQGCEDENILKLLRDASREDLKLWSTKKNRQITAALLVGELPSEVPDSIEKKCHHYEDARSSCSIISDISR